MLHLMTKLSLSVRFSQTFINPTTLMMTSLASMYDHIVTSTEENNLLSLLPHLMMKALSL